MEDISMILNTGDVPNLYAADEKAEIIEKMQTVARNEVRKLKIFNAQLQIKMKYFMTSLHYDYCLVSKTAS